MPSPEKPARHFDHGQIRRAVPDKSHTCRVRRRVPGKSTFDIARLHEVIDPVLDLPVEGIRRVGPMSQHALEVDTAGLTAMSYELLHPGQLIEGLIPDLTHVLGIGPTPPDARIRCVEEEQATQPIGMRASDLLSDIGPDAGVQRGSLYNAFGSKEALFLCAYERYAAEYLNSISEALGSGTLRQRLTAFFDAAIANFCTGSPPRGCPTTRGLMEVASVEGEGLDENTRQAFADLLTRLIVLIEGALSEGVERGEFKGDPKAAALHIVAVARGLVVLERAFSDEAQLRRIARHTVDLVLGRGGP
jgi:TetR/AcrR family transcriptional regulator, transcriptional repressor for nem operon